MSPCYSVQQATLTFNEHINIDRLERALRAKGYSTSRDKMGNISFSKGGASGSYDAKANKMNASGSSKPDLSDVKKEYSVQTVEDKAQILKKKGFRLVDVDGKGHYKLTRAPQQVRVGS